MSGGGAKQLMTFLELPVIHIDNLVLEGLVIIADDLAKNKEYLV